MVTGERDSHKFSDGPASVGKYIFIYAFLCRAVAAGFYFYFWPASLTERSFIVPPW
jgi:hypothetical protein